MTTLASEKKKQHRLLNNKLSTEHFQLQYSTETMEGTVSVKAYLDASGQNPEIRRFELDSDVSTNFEYLRSKVASIFPSLNQQGFKVFWKDEEGDMIAVSSDEELMQALIHGRFNGLVRLYVERVGEDNPSTAGPSSQNGNANPNVEHKGVMCDGCDTGIRGLRFKCLVCSDYDLCSTCCDKGLHNHHYMLRLATPAADWQGCGRRGAGRQGFGAGWWGMPGFGGGQGQGQGWGGPGANMRKFWRNLMRNQPGAAAPPAADGQGAPNPCHPQASGEAGSTDSQQGDQQKQQQQREYLQHVGAQVSSLLEPFGIDVDVEVEEREAGVRQRCGGGRGQFRGQGQKLGGGGRCNRGGDGKGGRCNQKGKCKPSPACKKACGQQGQQTETPVEKPAEEPTTANQSAASAEPSSLSEAMASKPDMMSSEKSGSGDATADDASMDSGEDDASWIKIETKTDDMEVTVVQNEESAAKPAPAPTPSAPQTSETIPALKLYPSLKSQAPPQTQAGQSSAPPSGSSSDASLEAKVAEAIEQMRAMGFHDDGGWMTAMLYENNGDVYKVIDSVLRAAHNRRE